MAPVSRTCAKQRNVKHYEGRTCLECIKRQAVGLKSSCDRKRQRLLDGPIGAVATSWANFVFVDWDNNLGSAIGIQE